MTAPVLGKYSFYDGLEWKVFYPRTRYDQVVIDATTRFLRPATHTVNGKSFYNNGDVGIEIYPADIKMSANDNTTLANYLQNIPNVVTANNVIANGNVPVGNGSRGLSDSGIALQALKEMAEGKTNSYSTNLYKYSELNYKIIRGNSSLEVGSSFVLDTGNMNTYTVEKTASELIISGTANSAVIYLLEDGETENTYIVSGNLELSKLKVGDVLFITNLDYPDFWVKKIENYNNGTVAGGIKIYFSRLETQKIDLTNYLRNDNFISLTDKYIQVYTNASGNINAMSVRIENGGVYAKNVTKDSYLHMHWEGFRLYDNYYGNQPTIYDLVMPRKSGTFMLTNDSHIKSASVSGNTLTFTDESDNQTTFSGTKVSYGATSPSNPNTGDIWFDTSE